VLLGMFVFVNRRLDRVTLSRWDYDGFAIWYKRLEDGTLALQSVNDEASHVVLIVADLGFVLE
jgi:transposase